MSEPRGPGRAVTDGREDDDATVPEPRPGTAVPAEDSLAEPPTDDTGDDTGGDTNGDDTNGDDTNCDDTNGGDRNGGTPRPDGAADTPNADDAADPADAEGTPDADGSTERDAPGTDATDEGTPGTGTPETGTPETGAPETGTPAADAAPRRRRRRDPMAAALIGVLTLLLGFAFAVQVRSTDQSTQLSGAREEDLVRILDELNAQEDRLRQQIADQRTALQQLTNSDSQSATALEEARKRAEAIGILNGTVVAQGPGLRILVRDPDGQVRVADLLDAIQELRGAGAETMQIENVRIGVSTAVTGDPGALSIDGHPVSAPYEIRVIGSPQDLETAMNIPGGVVQRINGRGGSVEISQAQQVVVDALRPLDQPQYASPRSTGG